MARRVRGAAARRDVVDAVRDGRRGTPSALKAALEADRRVARREARQGPGAGAGRVTGRTVGPPLFESLEVLGRERDAAPAAAAPTRLDRVTVTRGRTVTASTTRRRRPVGDRSGRWPTARRAARRPGRPARGAPLRRASLALGLRRARRRRRTTSITLFQVWSTGRSDQARPGRRDRRARRRPVRRPAVAAAGGPARPRRRAVAAGPGAARRGHRRQAARATASPRPRRRPTTSSTAACRTTPIVLEDQGTSSVRVARSASPRCSRRAGSTRCCSSPTRTTRCGAG